MAVSAPYFEWLITKADIGEWQVVRQEGEDQLEYAGGYGVEDAGFDGHVVVLVTAGSHWQELALFHGLKNNNLSINNQAGLYNWMYNEQYGNVAKGSQYNRKLNYCVV